MPDAYACYTSASKKSHIIVINQNIIHCLAQKNYNSVIINVKLDEKILSICSMYSSPSSDLEQDFQEWVASGGQSQYKLILGDLNAHDPLWGYERSDVRGGFLIDQLLLYSLIVLNSPDSLPTFQNKHLSGHPDLSICTQDLFPYFQSSVVLEHLIGDHRPIVTTLDLTITPLPKRRYKTKNVPLSHFVVRTFQDLDSKNIQFNDIYQKQKFDEMFENFMIVLHNQANLNLKKKSPFRPVRFTWWSPQLRAQRNKLNALFKKYKRTTNPQDHILYKQERAKYKKSILTAKKQAWVNFCRNETTPWGKTKQIAFQKFQDKVLEFIPPDVSGLPSSRPSALFGLTEKIFGPTAVVPVQERLRPIFNDQLKFTQREVKNSIFNFKLNKAPGPDSVDHRMIRALFVHRPSFFVDMYNSALKLNYFPKAWKRGELVYFRKEGKPPHEHTSYRPITLLPIYGKIYEKLLLNRINYTLVQNGVLSGRHHGFLELKSTETALQTALSYIDLNKQNKHYTSFISLDFQGAFDNLPWNLAIQSLSNLHISEQIINIIASFLSERSAQVDWQTPDLLYNFVRGCPQGSCLGPFLWLALLETLLKSFQVHSCEILAYADDILLIVWAPSRNRLETIGNEAITHIQNWATRNHLTISGSKSQSITFGKTKPLKRPPIFKLNNENIKSNKLLVYLGVTLDENLTFLPHLNKKREHITQITQNLFKFSSISGRLPTRFFKIWYQAILQRQIAYACSIWYPRMWRSHGVRHLLAAQRRVLLLITRAYRNTSTAALQVLTGLPPLDIQIRAEAEFSLVTRLGVSVDNDFAPLYSCKSSKYLLKPTFNGIKFLHSPLDTHSSVTIYTDGSKTEEGTGAAFCAYSEDLLIHEWKSRLAGWNSVFQAELFAIWHAIVWANGRSEEVFWIRSDSLSGILAIDKSNTRNFLVANIQLLLQETGKTIFFSWVRGHSGVEGNELADHLARSATSDLCLPSSFLPIPPTHLKQIKKKSLIDQWQERWDLSEVGVYTRDFLPTVSPDLLIHDRTLILFLTNHGPFQEHLYQINKSDSPLCVCGELANSLHYILDCTLTSHYHIRKSNEMSLRDWLKYLFDKPVLLQRIKACMTLIERNENIFQNPNPF